MGSNGGLDRYKRLGLPGHPLGKNPSDVWTMATASYRGAHHAVYPVALPERAIQAGCPDRRCRRLQDALEARARPAEGPPRAARVDEAGLPLPSRRRSQVSSSIRSSAPGRPRSRPSGSTDAGSGSSSTAPSPDSPKSGFAAARTDRATGEGQAA